MLRCHKARHRAAIDMMLKILTIIARIVLGATFVFSGFVKAIDPLGTVYKFQDYLTAMGLGMELPQWMLVIAAVTLSTAELVLGVMLLLVIARRLTAKIALAFMTVMTLLTVWIYIADPVEDCGCFGEALILTNGQTLLKNIVLLACAALLVWKPMLTNRFLNRGNQLLVFQCSLIASVVLSMWCLYDLPLIDFRPYHIGANIREGMLIPDDAEQPVFETTFIMQKDGVTKEFSVDNYPDSTWTFVDSKSKVIKEGYVPPIHDFSIITADGDDITDDVISHKGLTFLLIAPFLNHADDSNFGDIDALYEYAQENNIPFYCLTSSSDDDINRWKDITGAEYPFCQTDGTTLKTIIRSNPGLVLLRDGIIIGKWSHNSLPAPEKIKTFTTSNS